MQFLFSAYRYQRLIRQLADGKGQVRLPAEAGEGRDRVQRRDWYAGAANPVSAVGSVLSGEILPDTLV